MEPPEARYEAQDSGAERPRTKRVYREREEGETTQINGTREPHPCESQQDDLARTFATPRDLDSATPAPVRRSNLATITTLATRITALAIRGRVRDRSAAIA